VIKEEEEEEDDDDDDYGLPAAMKLVLLKNEIKDRRQEPYAISYTIARQCHFSILFSNFWHFWLLLIMIL
jgi:hypothetical protein